MTAHWSKKLDPYWSIEDMMKTNKHIFSHRRRCKEFKYKMLCHLAQKMQTKACVIGSVELH